MQEISRELVAASSKPLVLSLLQKQESYGYQIIADVKQISGGSLQWTDGMLYPVLHRLEREGLVESFWQKAETGRKRKYYRITKQGIAEIDAQKDQWASVNQALNQLWGGSAEPCTS